MSKRFKRLAAEAGVPVIKLHEGGRHTGNSLMRDAEVSQELRMRAIGHSDKAVNDRYTHVLVEAHLAAAEQTAALFARPGVRHDPHECSPDVLRRLQSSRLTTRWQSWQSFRRR